MTITTETETDTETPAPQANLLNLLINIWTSPTTAFRDLHAKSRAWFPLLAIVFIQIAVAVLYSYNVDFDWMLEQSIAASGRELTPEQVQAMERMQGFMGPNMSAITSSIGILIVIPLMLAISAGYYTIISTFTADGNRFGQWFGFVAWCSTPMIFASLASAVTIFLNSNGQIMQNELNPLSLNSLIFHLKTGEPGATFLSSLDLTLMWSLALNVIGYKVWTGKSMAVSASVALAPFVLVFAIFGFISFS